MKLDALAPFAILLFVLLAFEPELTMRIVIGVVLSPLALLPFAGLVGAMWWRARYDLRVRRGSHLRHHGGDC